MEIRIKKLQFFILLFVTLLSTITYLLNEKESRIINLKKQLEEEHHHQLNAALLNYKEENEIIFYNMINTPDVLALQKAALDAKNDAERDIYRKKLYKKLKPLYTYLKHYGIKQLHFHFPDATSFLRLHKPLKYGDNLTDVRYSIVLANKNLKEVTGFEEGRIFNGYRFVYPLIYKGEHIGSVEVSIGFNAINKRVKEIYNTYQYMILNKSVVEGKLFKGEKRNYAVSQISSDFYHEANAFVNYKNELQKKNNTITKDEFDKINSSISKNITLQTLLQYKDLVSFAKVDKRYYSISFHPIKNIKKENIGYIISYEKSPTYTAILSEYYGKVIFLTLLILIVFIFLYKIQKAKEELQVYSAKALEASKSKSEFLANMSHEIRTPLNAILGFVDILRKEETNRKSLEYVNIIHDASYSLLKIIEDILDFSKIESGKLEIDNIDFNTRKELEIIMHLFDARCSQKDISLSLLIDSSVPDFIHSDPLRIKQVITNLLSNAIKFTDNGKKIVVKIDYKDQNLLISVIDQGKGIAQDKQKHIFEAFSQEDSSTTRKFGGTGLGLSISSELVRLMGGKLQLKSELGEGSEFYFSIPVKVGQATDEKDFTDDEISFHGILLLVEDNKTNQKFMQIILDDLGLEIEIANDGVEAIDMFTAKKYDIILMDENMPNMGGIEATAKILKIEKEKKLQHTPIIALTANALKGDKEKFMGAGMDEYITKPVDVDHLSEILSKYLKQRV
jgi:signal transduction histidine kinase/CheY-like chemotaxis protein